MTQNIADLAREYLELKDQAALINERITAITTQFRALGTGKHAAGAAVVSVSTPNRRFNPTEAARVLPAELLEACRESVVTAARAKAVLPPALYELCSPPIGDLRISVGGAS